MSTRTLHIIRSVNPVHGGVMEGLRQYAMRLQALGHGFEVLTLDAPSDPWVPAFPAPTHALGPVTGKYGYCPGVVDWIKTHAADYDAVVVHGLWQYHGFAAWRALHAGPTPYYVFTHGMLDPWFKRTYPLKHLKKWLYWPWADYRLLRDARAVLFTAEEEMRVAPDTFWLYRAKPVLAGFGIRVEADQSEGEEARFLEAFPQLAGKRLALFLARVHPKKGVDLLVEAFIRVAHRAPDLHLVIAGPDPDHLRPALEARAREAGVAERITWTGMITGDVKWGAFKAAEVYVLPSHQENFGITAVEAMAVKTPVLLTRRVNIWREIEADGAGLAGEDTVEGITDLFERWLQLDEPARARMRENGPACYRRHFHIDTAADRLVEIVKSQACSSAAVA